MLGQLVHRSTANYIFKRFTLLGELPRYILVLNMDMLMLPLCSCFYKGTAKHNIARCVFNRVCSITHTRICLLLGSNSKYTDLDSTGLLHCHYGLTWHFFSHDVIIPDMEMAFCGAAGQPFASWWPLQTADPLPLGGYTYQRCESPRVKVTDMSKNRSTVRKNTAFMDTFINEVSPTLFMTNSSTFLLLKG